MKLSRIFWIAGGIGLIAVVSEGFYQRHVTDDARLSLLAWIEGKSPLFEPDFEWEEKLCREFCSRGVVQIKSGEQEWRYVDFTVKNKEGQSAMFMLRRRESRWVAQGILNR